MNQTKAGANTNISITLLNAIKICEPPERLSKKFQYAWEKAEITTNE
jgi:hypothetical protein